MATREKRETIVVDPELWMRRRLHYQEKNSGWHIFKNVYWAVYALFLGIFLMYYPVLNLSLPFFAGISLIVFAIMAVVFGFAEALHNKLMHKYG
jgi:hypothetical protein